MIIKIIFEEDNPVFQDSGTSYIKTSDSKAFEEILKHKCPIRLSAFLDKMINTNVLVEEIYKTPQEYDFLIDLSKETNRINQEYFSHCVDFDDFLVKTKILNPYGTVRNYS